MIDQEILKENAAIARAFLNRSVIEQEFSWRFQEKICRAEIQEAKKRFNRISLIVSIIIVLALSLIIVLDNQMVIILNDSIIPILFLPLIIVLIATAIVEFYLVRKIGYSELLKKLGTTEAITKELNGYKKTNTRSYFTIQQHFETVKKIETTSLLPGYLLKILFDLKKIDEEKITYNIFYKYLFYICLGKSKLIYQALAELENKEEVIDMIVEFSEELKKLANEYSVGNLAPHYFINKVVKILDNIDKFDPKSVDSINLDNSANFVAIDVFLKKITNIELDWILIGSTNLAVQNVNVQAKDIDIITTKDDASRVMDLFKTYVIKELEYSESENYKSYFGKFKIKGVTFEIMAELEYRTEKGEWFKSSSLERKEYIEYKGSKLPVLPLKYEKEFYESMNRENDQQKIQLIDKSL